MISNPFEKKDQEKSRHNSVKLEPIKLEKKIVGDTKEVDQSDFGDFVGYKNDLDSIFEPDNSKYVYIRIAL